MFLAKHVSQQKLEFEPNLVGLIYNSSYLEGCGGRISSSKPAWTTDRMSSQPRKATEPLFQTILKARNLAQ